MEQHDETAMLRILGELTEEEFREVFWPVARMKEFSVYASGDKTTETRQNLRERLQERGIDEDFWKNDAQLEVLVYYITGKLVMKPRVVL